jgi:hypothetical protein
VARVEAGESDEEGAGFARGLAAAAALFLGEGAGGDQFLGFLKDVGVDDLSEGFDGLGEAGRCDEARAEGGGALEIGEALLDVGLGHPDDEGFDGGFVTLGKFEEGDRGVAEVGEDGIHGLGRQ